MAFGQYGRASGDDFYLDQSRTIFKRIIERRSNPKGRYEKQIGNRPLKGFALPMILANLSMELGAILDSIEVSLVIDHCVEEVMDVFLDKETGLIYENVAHDRSHVDSFDGRLLNPGHGIEAMWFMIDIGVHRNDQSLIKTASEVIINILEYSWDEQDGGIFYFLDAKGHPVQQLEWDQKLWWVHLETLVGLAKAYESTGEDIYLQWYEKVHNYTWSHFPDPEFGEWYGYLKRNGSPLFTSKGGKWKGCFHVPRAMYQCWKTFENIQDWNKS
jgi:N-acylglucosamine 2-epimerase